VPGDGPSLCISGAYKTSAYASWHSCPAGPGRWPARRPRRPRPRPSRRPPEDRPEARLTRRSGSRSSPPGRVSAAGQCPRGTGPVSKPARARSRLTARPSRCSRSRSKITRPGFRPVNAPCTRRRMNVSRSTRMLSRSYSGPGASAPWPFPDSSSMANPPAIGPLRARTNPPGDAARAGRHPCPESVGRSRSPGGLRTRHESAGARAGRAIRRAPGPVRLRAPGTRRNCHGSLSRPDRRFSIRFISTYVELEL